MDKRAKHFYEFGSFRVDAVERLLLRDDGEVVPLTPKVFDILLVLVQNSGHILEKDKLMEAVWPDSTVEEANLTRNVSTLRRALGENPTGHQYIETIPWRGYRFAPGVREFRDEDVDLILEKHTRSHVHFEEEEEVREKESGDPKEEVGFLLPAASPTLLRHKESNRKILAVSLLLLGLIVTAFFWWRPGRLKQAEAPASVKSMAVLPFGLISMEGSDEYLGLGMADALITKLSNVKQVVVRPTSAVRKYTAPGQDPLAAGRELGVESVLEGSIQKSGERMRVTVQLVSVGDGTPLWGEKFDEQFTNIFEMQDSISERVVAALALRPTGEERSLLAKRHTANTEAHRLYLRGRYFWNKRTAEGLEKGIEYFEQAIEKDPAYALAHAGLADCYNVLSWYSGLPPKETFPRAKAAAAKALEIDDLLAEAHASLGFVKLAYEWDWSGAEREFKRAIEINPNYETAHHWYSEYLTVMRRHGEAIAEIAQAQELDPLSLVINTDVGVHFYYARRYGEAIEQYRQTLDIDQNFAYARYALGLAYMQKAMFAEAVAELQKACELSGDSPGMVAVLGHAYAASGRTSEAMNTLHTLKELSKRKYVPSYYMAMIYVGLGERNQALHWLEKAYEERAASLAYLNVDPNMDDLRSDSRFQDLVRRVGLPSAAL